MEFFDCLPWSSPTQNLRGVMPWNLEKRNRKSAPCRLKPAVSSFPLMVLSGIGSVSRGLGDLCCAGSSLERQQFKLSFDGTQQHRN
eukprot:scaffold178287_cov19-Tisochrysis_lutea.AAC.1